MALWWQAPTGLSLFKQGLTTSPRATHLSQRTTDSHNPSGAPAPACERRHPNNPAFVTYQPMIGN